LAEREEDSLISFFLPPPPVIYFFQNFTIGTTKVFGRMKNIQGLVER
jgi:hypothetical protein